MLTALAFYLAVTVLGAIIASAFLMQWFWRKGREFGDSPLAVLGIFAISLWVVVFFTALLTEPALRWATRERPEEVVEQVEEQP